MVSLRPVVYSGPRLFLFPIPFCLLPVPCCLFPDVSPVFFSPPNHFTFPRRKSVDNLSPACYNESTYQATGNTSPGRARQESARHRLQARIAAAGGYHPLMAGVSRALLRDRVVLQAGWNRGCTAFVPAQGRVYFFVLIQRGSKLPLRDHPAKPVPRLIPPPHFKGALQHGS